MPASKYVAFCLQLTVVGIRCADHVTPLYPQKLALTSPTGGGRSVDIVRLRTKATEYFFCLRSLIATGVEPVNTLGFVEPEK